MTQYYLAELDQWFETINELVEANRALKTLTPEQERANSRSDVSRERMLAHWEDPEFRERVGGRTKSEEEKINISAARKGKSRSAESIVKREETRRLKREANRAQGIPHPLKGRTQSEESIVKRQETRRRNREAKRAQGIPHPLKGKKKSPESEAQRQETRRRNREAKLAAAQALTQTE